MDDGKVSGAFRSWRKGLVSDSGQKGAQFAIHRGLVHVRGVGALFRFRCQEVVKPNVTRIRFQSRVTAVAVDLRLVVVMIHLRQIADNQQRDHQQGQDAQYRFFHGAKVVFAIRFASER